MVEILGKPEWGFSLLIVMMIITIFLIGLGLFLAYVKERRWLFHIFIASIVSLVVTFIVFGTTNRDSFQETQTVNNPFKVAEEHKSSAKIVTEEMETVIAKKTHTDKTVLDDDSDGKKLFKTLSNGEPVKFHAIEDGKAFAGTLYFTEKKMIINIVLEDDNIEVIEVPTR